MSISDRPISRAGLSINYDVIELLQLLIENNIDYKTMKLFWIDYMKRELNNSYDNDHNDNDTIAENLSNQGLSISIISKYFNTFENFKRVFKLFLNELYEDNIELRNEKRPASFSTILTMFKSQHEIQESKKIYFLCDLTEMIEIAKGIDHIPFNSLKDRYTFCSAPVKNDNNLIVENFVLMASDFVKRNKVFLRISTNNYNVSTPEKLFIVESYFQVMEIYIWLANKFGVSVFPDKALCEDELQKLNIIILEALKRFNLSKKELDKKKKQQRTQASEKKVVDLLDY